MPRFLTSGRAALGSGPVDISQHHLSEEGETEGGHCGGDEAVRYRRAVCLRQLTREKNMSMACLAIVNVHTCR